MSIAARPLFAFDNSYVRELEGLYEPWQATPVAGAPAAGAQRRRWPPSSAPTPRRCARPTASRSSPATRRPRAPTPVAQAYAGHQFGGFSPRLGDGRALLLGEVRRRPRPPPRPAPEGLGPHAVRPRRRRQGGRRADAARVRDRRGDARARHPDHARARGRRDRRGRRARDAAARRGAHPRRGEPHPRRHVPVRGVNGGAAARAAPRRLRDRPPPPGTRRDAEQPVPRALRGASSTRRRR